jgi:hypothetical protein
MTWRDWRCLLFGHQWVALPAAIGWALIVCRRCPAVDAED